MVYEDNNGEQENTIRGKALYFSTSQVANLLNQPDSKVRYYTNVFDEILHIEVSNKQRRYTEKDIDKLRFIIELKEEGMTIKQIQEYCQQVDFEDSKEIQIKESNPLGIQALAKALLEQQATLINEMKQDIIIEVISKVEQKLNDQNDEFNNMKISLTNDVAITVEDTMNKQLENSSKDIEGKLENKFQSFSKRIEEENKKLINEFKYVKTEEINNQPKSLFDRLFGKKK